MTNACSGRGPALVLVANTRGARIVSRDAITTGSVGIQVALDLSEEYSGLAVTVVFRAGEEQADWAVIGSEPVMVPPQCLQEPGVMLYIGVYASDGDGNKVIPTVWASAGAVRQGVEPSGYDPVGPAPSWAAQVQQAAAEAVETANSVRADADAGAFDGEDGYSPTATVEQLADGATISITDKDGTTTATIHDGADGATGPEGPAGYSPSATVTQTASGATISITDQSGTTTADISNGAPGEPGQTGPIGPTGEDGFSPTVDVQPITGGHEVTITDADGPHSFDVMDGDPAEPGSITDEMLAPDGIKAQVTQLFGNQLVGTMSGTIDTAADAYAAPPMALTVEGASTQAGTPTPDAPVPILSVDDLSLVCAGKNLLDINAPRKTTPYTITGSGFHFTYAASGAHGNEDTYTISGNIVSYSGAPSYLGFGVEVSVTPNTTYALSIGNVTISDTSKTWYKRVAYYDADGQYLSYVAVGGGNTLTGTFTTPSDAAYAIVCICANAANVTVTVSDLQLEYGSTATAYEPYTGTTVPDLLPEGTSLRSLPDGTRDTLSLSYLRPSTQAGWAWYSRELVTRCKKYVFTSSETWKAYTYASGAGYYSTTRFYDRASHEKLCNMAVSAIRGNEGINTCYFGGGNELNMVGVSGSAPTVEDWVALLTDNPLEIVYALATPITTTFDPIELPTLPAPTATVWCDGGSAQPTYTMEYVQDTNIVIADLRAALADLATS